MNSRKKIGVLTLQGAFAEYIATLRFHAYFLDIISRGG
jgi:glutamine amidotransferase PdxT